MRKKFNGILVQMIHKLYNPLDVSIFNMEYLNSNLNREVEFHYAKANDRIELYNDEGTQFKKFIIKKQAVYPYWTIQPEFIDE